MHFQPKLTPKTPLFVTLVILLFTNHYIRLNTLSLFYLNIIFVLSRNNLFSLFFPNSTYLPTSTNPNKQNIAMADAYNLIKQSMSSLKPRKKKTNKQTNETQTKQTHTSNKKKKEKKKRTHNNDLRQQCTTIMATYNNCHPLPIASSGPSHHPLSLNQPKSDLRGVPPTR